MPLCVPSTLLELVNHLLKAALLFLIVGRSSLLSAFHLPPDAAVVVVLLKSGALSRLSGHA